MNPNRPVSTKLTDLRSTKSRAALRSAMLLLLQQQPLAGISVRDLTSTAQVGYATFFRHYPSLQSLLEDVAKEQIDRVINSVLPVMHSSSTEEACRALCAHIGEHRAMWLSLLTGGAFDAIKQELLLLSRNYAASHSGLGSWLPEDLGVGLSVACMMELLLWWLSAPSPGSSDEVGVLLHKIIHERLLMSEWLA